MLVPHTIHEVVDQKSTAGANGNCADWCSFRSITKCFNSRDIVKGVLAIVKSQECSRLFIKINIAYFYDGIITFLDRDSDG